MGNITRYLEKVTIFRGQISKTSRNRPYLDPTSIVRTLLCPLCREILKFHREMSLQIVLALHIIAALDFRALLNPVVLVNEIGGLILTALGHKQEPHLENFQQQFQKYPFES